MSEWKKVKLGDICEITSSKRCHASERSTDGVPFYCSKEINEPATFSMYLIKILPVELSNAFLYCAMRYGGISEMISPLANGVNVLHLKPEAMMGLEMMVPSREIVNIKSLSSEYCREELDEMKEIAHEGMRRGKVDSQTMMYWHIGERINREVLGNQRAEYGKQIVAQVATQLQDEYGRKGFETRNIRRMMQCNSTRQASRLLSTLQSCLHARFCSARFDRRER